MSWNEWRSHDLEAQFNPRAAVGVDVATASLDLWATESKARKVELTGRFDLPYGAHKLMRFDLHLGAANKPIIINIHGGYWRALDKADVNHHMADLAKTGFGLVNINYPLCPEVSLTQIIEHLNHGVEEVLKRLEDAEQQQPIILMGHSAGAHIALHLSNHSNLKDRLVGVVGLSGIYETELVRELSVNEDVRLTEAEAKRWNCVTHMPLLGPAYYIAVGGVSHLVGLTNHGLWRARCANGVTLRSFMYVVVCIISIWLIAFRMVGNKMVKDCMSGC